MRKLLTVAFIFSTFCAVSQGKTLYSTSLVKPKMGQWSAFETAWKAHVAKFHNGDDKRWVSEILTGPDAGSYLFVEGPFSYADMDKERPNNAAHDLDYEKNVAPKVELETGNYIFSMRDSLSFNSAIQSDKALVTVTRVKNGRMGDYLQELKRATLVANKAKAPFGVNTYVQHFAGSDPVVVTVRSLKDGFKELENNYFNRPQNEFRDVYLKEYNQEQWDKRQKLLNDDIVSREVHLEKYRKDLSSKQ